MSALKIKAPRGTFDVLGEQAQERATLETRARSLLESAGYERIETPAFEATELFERGVGANTESSALAVAAWRSPPATASAGAIA